MKRISILALAVFVVLICISLIDIGKGFVDGWNEEGDSRGHSRTLVNLRITKIDMTLPADSLYNSALKEHVPYHLETIDTFVQESNWGMVVTFLILPVGLFAFYGFYCLIRLLISVARKEVFICKNVQRMRIFVYGMILVAFVMELRYYSEYLSAISQVQLPGYEICSYSQDVPWLFLFLLALFTEIFAAGVKIKEEQDLTV